MLMVAGSRVSAAVISRSGIIPSMPKTCPRKVRKRDREGNERQSYSREKEMVKE